MEILIATNNEHKVKEYQELLKDLNIKCLSLKDLNIVCEPEETGTTFKENSYIKAKEIAKYTSIPVLADDSGLVLNAYPNLLGVYSHRFLAEHTYYEKAQEVLRILKNQSRDAYFECCITLLNFKEKPLYFEGICHGQISMEYKGEHGFGYDPIFIPNGYECTFAQLDSKIKNQLSHRGRACAKLIEFLKKSL